MNAEALAVAGVLIFVVNGLVQFWVEPFKRKYPDADLWWLLYVSWVVAGVLAAAIQLNVFSSLPILKDYPYVGIALTALGIGRGSNFLADAITFFKKPASSGDVYIAPEGATVTTPSGTVVTS